MDGDQSSLQSAVDGKADAGRTLPEQPDEGRWTWRLLTAASVACLGLFSLGLFIGFIPTSIHDLNSNRSPLRVTLQQQSWYASLPFLGALVGTFFSGTIMDWLGRKTCLMLATIPTIVGYIIVCAARDVGSLYASAFVIGFGLVMYESAARVYVAEIATVDSRSILMSCQDLFASAGYLLAIVTANYVRWNWMAILCAASPASVAVLLLICPESPRWLAMRSETEAATKALCWLRGDDAVASAEVQRIRSSFAGSAKPLRWRSLLQSPHLRAVLISQALFLVREFSGYTPLRLYMITVFESVHGGALSSHTQSAIAAAVLLLGHVIGSAIVDCFRRTILLAACLLGMAVGLTVFGATFVMHSVLDATTRQQLSWLPMVALTVAVLFYTLGVGPLPHIISNELASTKARSRVHSLGVTVNYISAFAITKSFVDLQHAVGAATTFWIYGGVCLLGAGFVCCCCVPETKGRSLEETESQFGEGNGVAETAI